ncbi:MAG: MFS transporter [Anaerolineae bacterium]|nr:MFS transporter [Anaerolineae bacterium]
MIKIQSPDFFAPHVVVDRSPVYYGWVVWLIATVGILTTTPAQNFTVAQFIDYMIRDFGIDRSTLSLLFSVGTLIGAFCLTWVGRRIDRHGNRLTGVAISSLFAIALVIFSMVTTPLMLMIVFIAVRGLGQGSLWLVNSTAISQWFSRRCGFMMSLTLLIFALFQMAYVPWLQYQLEVHDWREMWVFLGTIVGCITVPVTWALMRNRPEDFGLLPDGIRNLDPEETRPLSSDDLSWTLQEAKRTSIFWIFVFGRLIAPMLGSGLIFHQVSIFAVNGYSAEVTAHNYAIISIVNAVSSIICGLIVNRLKPHTLLAVQMLALIVTLLAAIVMSNPVMVVLFAVGCGVLFGSAGIFDGAVWSSLFGRQYQGTIRGFVVMITIVGAAIGPVIFGFSYDHLGSYTPALLLGVAMCLIALVLSMVARVPAPKSAIH